MLRIRVADADMVLHPSGAAFLSAEQTLLVADAHFGKAVTFRKLGVPVPSGTTTETLDELSAALAVTKARRIVFLGDFLHSRRSHAAGTMAALARWRAEHADVEITLVRGNHDDRAGDPPESLDIAVVDEPLPLGPFALFWFGDDTGALPDNAVGVLPAFGSFTGMHRIEPHAGDRIFPVAGDVVRAIPALPVV